MLYEPWDDMRRRFHSVEAFVHLCLSSVGSTFLLYEVPSLKVDCLFPYFEMLLPFFQVAKLTL
jgi:hypothetical protein